MTFSVTFLQSSHIRPFAKKMDWTGGGANEST